MKEHGYLISDFDMKRFRWLIDSAPKISEEDKRYLIILEKALKKAEIVDPKNVPPDIITMNSKVRLKIAGEDKPAVYTLVFPNDADAKRNMISITSAMGIAMIGEKVNQPIEWETEEGKQAAVVKEIVYQPEAAGNHYF